MRFSILIVSLVGLFIACNKNHPAVPISVQIGRDTVAIDKYLADKGITAIHDTTGVRYVIHSLGTGPKPVLTSSSTDCIRVSYVGTLMSDGSQFDSNTSLKYPLGSLIAGWKVVFPKLPQGSKATLYIPSSYAYGSVSQTNIPANSNLIFDVELLDVYEYNEVSGYCYDDPLLLPEVQLAKDVAIIDSYLATNNISAQTDPSGLRYTIQSLGTGPTPTLSNCILAKYTGTLLSTGDQFDQNILGYKAPLKNLIEGWKVGLPLLPKGTKATLYVPSGMAYGSVSNGSRIPANANLVFEIELVDVTNYDAATDTCN
jgi:FKBP-type peptidyl-prolyl cis-trans isomerase